MPTLIISTPIIFTSDYSELMNPVGVLKTIKEQGAFQHGTWGAETIPELQAFGERILKVPRKRGLNISDCTFGRTDFERCFYCEKVFPIYSEVMGHQQLIDSLRIYYRETLKKIEEMETATQIQQRLFEELSATEKRYRELVKNLRNIVFRYDEKGVLTFVNPPGRVYSVIR